MDQCALAGDDYEDLTGGIEVTFLAGDAWKPVEIDIVNDQAVEGTEQFGLYIEIDTGTKNDVLGELNKATVTIKSEDTDIPGKS